MNGRRCRQSKLRANIVNEKKIKTNLYLYKDGAERRQLVIEGAGLLDVARLERDLQTTASHAKSHRIHVDVIRQSGFLRRAVVAACRQILNVRICRFAVSVN